MRSRSPSRRVWTVARGIAAGALCLTLLVGTPWALFVLAGSPIPEALPDVEQVWRALSQPDLDGSLFLGALSYIAWTGWLSFAFSVLLELPAAVRGHRPLRIPGLRLQQRAAAALIGMVLGAFAAGPVATAAVMPAAADSVVSVVTVDDDSRGDLHQHAEARRHTVEEGDYLISIAQQRLGDWTRWLEIAELNYGIPQPGSPNGLDQSHMIFPGWVLTLPPVESSAGEAPAATSHVADHVVREGDSLWRIAAADLGSGATDADIADEWPRWYAVNREVIGDDPDLILPGMRLQHPDAETADDQLRRDPVDAADSDHDPETHPEPSTAAPTTADPPPEPDLSDADTDDTAPVPDTEDAPVVDMEETPSTVLGKVGVPDDAEVGSGEGEVDDDHVLHGFPVRTATGIGGLLAAGLIALIAAKRTQQRRRRRVGQSMPEPDVHAAEVAQDVRNVADAFGVELVDRALRTLAVHSGATGSPLPAVRAARLTADQFELYLAEPARLPQPWQGTAEETIWALPADVDTSELLDAQNLGDVSAPYPGLVTIGHDTEGGHILVDLEYLGALGVHGPEPQARDVLAAMAVELATSIWADDLTVAIVGTCAELEPALGTGRVRHVEDLDALLDVLETHAARDRDALNHAGLSAASAARNGAGEWAPEITLIATPLSREQHQRLDALIHGAPRVAVAAVTTTEEPLTEWGIQLTPGDEDQAVLVPIGLPIAPQRITETDYQAVLKVLRTSDAAPVGDSTAEEPSQWLGTVDPEVATAFDQEWTPASPNAAEDAGSGHTNGRHDSAEESNGAYVPAEGETDRNLDVPADIPDQASAGAPDLGSDLVHPVIRVLGPVRIDGARGSVDSRHIGQLTEIAAYVALHPGTASEDLDAAIWPGEPNKRAARAQACSRLRNWLGDDPDGNRYFPQMTGGRYEFLDSVRTDWDLFRDLVSEEPHEATTQHLEAALGLVTGQPFTGTIGRRPKYRWADRLKQQMITVIADAAVVAAERALDDGNPQRARSAVTIGLQAEPGMEQLWRYLLIAEHRAGNLPGMHAAAGKLQLLLDELGSDPEPETAALLDDLLAPSRARPRPVAI